MSPNPGMHRCPYPIGTGVPPGRPGGCRAYTPAVRMGIPGLPGRGPKSPGKGATWGESEWASLSRPIEKGVAPGGPGARRRRAPGRPVGHPVSGPGFPTILESCRWF